MTCQDLSRRMLETAEARRLRFQLMAMDLLARMGARIRARREELGLSRADLARLMPGKTNENQVYRWETGKHQPQPDTLEALAKALECDVAYFMASDDGGDGAAPDLVSALGSEASKLAQILANTQEILRLLRPKDLSSEAEEELVETLPDSLSQADGKPKPPKPERSPTRPADARRKPASS